MLSDRFLQILSFLSAIHDRLTFDLYGLFILFDLVAFMELLGMILLAVSYLFL